MAQKTRTNPTTWQPPIQIQSRAQNTRVRPDAEAIIHDNHPRARCSASIEPHASKGTDIPLVLGDWIQMDPARQCQSRRNAFGRVQRSISTRRNPGPHGKSQWLPRVQLVSRTVGLSPKLRNLCRPHWPDCGPTGQRQNRPGASF